MGIFNFLNKKKEPDELVIRTAFAFNQSIFIGQKILAKTFAKVKELKGLQDNDELDFSDEQQKLILMEVAKLSLFWLTSNIWSNLAIDENHAKKANTIIFSWFKDKYNIEHADIEEYAKVAGTSEEIQIYGKNVARIFDCYGAVEILEINFLLIGFAKESINSTKDAFELPLEKIKKKIM